MTIRNPDKVMISPTSIDPSPQSIQNTKSSFERLTIYEGNWQNY